MLKNANEVRSHYIDLIKNFLTNEGEDVALIASNSINLPILIDGAERSIEVTVKVPKLDETYEKREEYELTLKRNEEKRVEKEIQKQKNIERDEKRREEMRKKREKREGELKEVK